jgi:hypothetical protein
MRQQLLENQPSTAIAGTSLQSLVNELTANLLQPTTKNQNIVVNEITADIAILADQKKIQSVLTDLMFTVLNNARNGRIHISAERFREIVTIEIEERNTYNGYALAFSIKALEPIARLVGGYISIKGQHQLTTTVSFSFPNQPGTYSYDC